VLPVTTASSHTPCVEERELATAARLQRALLPPTPFAQKGWALAHHACLYVSAADDRERSGGHSL
jgi:hypothetical protein